MKCRVVVVVYHVTIVASGHGWLNKFYLWLLAAVYALQCVFLFYYTTNKKLFCLYPILQCFLALNSKNDYRPVPLCYIIPQRFYFMVPSQGFSIMNNLLRKKNVLRMYGLDERFYLCIVKGLFLVQNARKW